MYSTESQEIYRQYDKQFLAIKGARKRPIDDARLADIVVDELFTSPSIVACWLWTNRAPAG